MRLEHDIPYITIQFLSCTLNCFTAFYSIALHCTALYCTAVYLTPLHLNTLHCTAPDCSVLRLYTTTPHCTEPYCSAFDCTVFCWCSIWSPIRRSLGAFAIPRTDLILAIQLHSLFVFVFLLLIPPLSFPSLVLLVTPPANRGKPLMVVIVKSPTTGLLQIEFQRQLYIYTPSSKLGQSVYLSLSLSACHSVCLSVCLSVCTFTSFWVLLLCAMGSTI